MTENKPTAVVLCAGIGLVSYALKENGFNTIGAIDYAEIPELSYAANFPDTPFWRASLRSVSAQKICERFNCQRSNLSLVQISTPCTGYSLTGTYEPTHADNELFLVAMFIALQIESKVILFENVPSMTYEKMKVVFGILTGFFNQFEEKYIVKAAILNSSNYGDPQTRERLFIQCVRKDVGIPMWPFPVPKEKRRSIGEVLPNVKYLESTNFGEHTYENNEASCTITGHAHILLGYEGYEKKAKAKDLAPLMGLPDTFILPGNESEQMLGVGNGVPVGMMSALLRSIKYDVLGYEGPVDLSHYSIRTELLGVSGYTLYKGPSRINGKEIIAVMTLNSKNEKTGDMALLYILNIDEDLTLAKDPYLVWKKYMGGDYPMIETKDYFIFKDFPIRFGAFGDSFAVPEKILFELHRVASNFTCYTHQWDRPDAASLKSISMAIVENLEQYQKATAAGWRTYRIISKDEPLEPKEMQCPHYTRSVQCKDCNLCTGNMISAHNIVEYPLAKKKVNLKNTNSKKSISDVAVGETLGKGDESPVTENSIHTLREGSPRIMSAQELLQQSFSTLDFSDRWEEFLGQPAINFNAVIHGLAGHGKSTLAILFADYLCSFGKVIYFSSEEGFNKTFQDKLKKYCKDSQMLIADLQNYDDILANVNLRDYNFIFIDSLDTMKLGPVEMKSLRHLNPDSGFVTVSQSTKQGLMKGSYELVHDCDIAISVFEGIATTTKNRFKEKGKKFIIFNT